MIVIDDFIKDESLLNDLQNDKTFFDNGGQYMWWDGWGNTPGLINSLCFYAGQSYENYGKDGCLEKGLQWYKIKIKVLI